MIPRVLLAAVATVLLAVVGVADASAKRPPRPVAPKDGASFGTVPSFSWKKARGAAKYEFQLAADRRFRSAVWSNQGSFETLNTFATVDQALADGDYFWRVRSISKRDNAGRWSRPRKIKKDWRAAPKLVSPTKGETITYPGTPLVLRWRAVPRAYKYLVWIGTDPTLASVDQPIETSANALSPPQNLAPGRYYWAVTPLDAQRHRGTRSAVGSFVWGWPSQTNPLLFDLNGDDRVFDPAVAWNPVPGAGRYEVEINPSEDFAVGSKVCCSEVVIGTSLSPKKTLPNNRYYWRMRAFNADGQAGAWNYGEPFRKTFDDVLPTVPNLRIRGLDSTQVSPGADTSYPIVKWDPVAGASSYDVQVGTHTGSFGCDWSTSAGWGAEYGHHGVDSSRIWKARAHPSRVVPP